LERGYGRSLGGDHFVLMEHRIGIAIHHRGTEGSSSDLTYDVLGAAIEVHRRLGPGLLESAYESCLSRELRHRNIAFERQVYLPLHYRGMDVKCGYRLDILIAKSVIVEVKSVSKITPLHVAQMLTYLKLTDLRVGLIINFNVEVLRLGVRRVIRG
jgi:GxxExxY protein